MKKKWTHAKGHTESLATKVYLIRKTGLPKLTSLGNPLERLSETIDFEMFRETLEAGLYRERLTNAGAKPYDYVLMFKILVLQRMYNLSDEQAEYQIVDRTSFRDFLGLSSGDKVPDARTIWAFREQLTVKALHDRLFADFDRFLREKNLIMNQGVIIDNSTVRNELMFLSH